MISLYHVPVYSARRTYKIEVRDICEKEKVKELLSLFETPFDIRTNRWIASMMRHPGTLRIKLLRALMRLKA